MSYYGYDGYHDDCKRDCYDYKHDCYDCKPKRDCVECKSKHPKPKGVIMRCGKEVEKVLYGKLLDIDPPTTPVVLAMVTIDTTCLCKALTKIDFSTIIAYQDRGNTELQYKIKLFKQCDGGPKQEVAGPYMYRRKRGLPFQQGDPPLKTTDSFSFTVCDCDGCPGCCVYTVELVDITILPSGETIDVASIDMSAINAIATSLCD